MTRRVKLPLEQRVTVTRDPDLVAGIEIQLTLRFDPKDLATARTKAVFDGLVAMLSALMSKAELKKFAATLERERAKLVAKA